MTASSPVISEEGKITFPDDHLAHLSDLTAYRHWLSEDYDEEEWHNLYQDDLEDLAQRWRTLDAEAQGLLAWAINRIL